MRYLIIILLFFTCKLSADTIRIDKLVMHKDLQNYMRKDTLEARISRFNAYVNTILPDTTTPPDPIDSVDFDIHYSANFENRSVGAYPASLAEEEFSNSITWSTWRDNQMSIVNDGSKCMQSFFAANTYHGTHGFEVPVPLTSGAALDEIYFSYNIKLVDWSFGQGGKLPALRLGPSWAGVDPPPDGSAVIYLMFENDSSVIWYNYYQNQTTTEYGESRSTGQFLPVDTWFNITIRASLGAVGTTNGILELFIDGVLVDAETGFNFKGSIDRKFEGFHLQGFFGGGDISYGPLNDCWMRIDDLTVFTYKPGISGIPYGTTLSSSGRILDLPLSLK